MKVNVTVKRKIVVNGKEYGSVEELPANIRTTYEKALSDGAVPVRAAGGSAVGGRITVGGTTYDSPESMPPEVRRLYDDAMAVSTVGRLAASPPITPAGGQEAATWAASPEVDWLASSPQPIGPGSISRASRASLVVVLGIAVLAVLLYLILR